MNVHVGTCRQRNVQAHAAQRVAAEHDDAHDDILPGLQSKLC